MTATHIDLGIVGRTRGTGRTGSAVAAGAYNACTRTDGPAGSYDYSRKAREHQAGCVMLPPGSPPGLAEPGALWRAAEAAERRADAQLARQVLISLPRECPPERRLALAKAVCAPWVAEGMGCQLDIHCPRASDGGEQPHAHILLTLRRVTDDGLAATKEREWNRRFREGEGRAMRQAIAERMTAYMAAHGIGSTVDARSLTDRGEDRTPEPTAPRADWQRWLRDGADPQATPITVAAALHHRRQRAELEAAESKADAARAERIALTQRLRAAQEASMAQTQTTCRPSVEEPWQRQEGGLDVLAEGQRHAAEAAYERWTQGRDALRKRHALADYVAYVQDHQARERAREREQAEAAPPEAEAAPAQTGPGTVAPATGGADHRTKHLPGVLAGRPQPIAPGWRVSADQAARTLTHRPPTGGAVVDHGDRLTHTGQLTPDLAAATVQVAAAHGWTSLRLTGSPDYRDAVATAAAMHTPPITTDHVLGREAAERVRELLRQRAAPAPLDSAAVQRLAETNPAAAARAHLDHVEARARATLTGEPTGSTVPADLARPRIEEAEQRRRQAREDEQAATRAAAEHQDEYPWFRRLRDPDARRRQGVLDAEMMRTAREADRLDSGHARTVRRIEREADKQARAHRTAHEDWRWSPTVRRAQADLATVRQVRHGMAQGAEGVAAAAANGDLAAAARLATVPARAAAPVDPRTKAAQAAHAAEQQARGPAALAMVRQTTAAVLAGDPATVAGLVAGDPAVARQAAADYAERQRREAEEQRWARDQAQRQRATTGPTVLAM